MLDALRAEWTKFWTIRGWAIGLTLAAALLVLFAYLTANGQHSGVCVPGPGAAGAQQPQCGSGHPYVPVGPDGEAVADSYYLAGRQLRGNGTISARVISLAGVTAAGPANAAPSLTRTRPGLAAWSKAGVIIAASSRQGAPYAAVMATARHGVRFQHDYTHDTAGLTGAVSAASPRWVRLTRYGDVLTAYDSVTGRTWRTIGSTTLHGLPRVVDAGLFVTSPVTYGGLATMATARFDNVALLGATLGRGWHGQGIGQSPHDFYDVLGHGGYHRAGVAFVLSGSGDIAAALTAGGDTPASILTQALIAALIVIVIVAAMFITSEYRRGLIRTTLAAVPRRGDMLTSKALVIAGATFTAGAAAGAISIALGDHIAATGGNYILPMSAPADLRIAVGTGAILALSAVAILAIGALLRRTAATVVAGIVVLVLPAMLTVPYISGTRPGSDPALPLWLLRLSPAAGFSILGSLPRSAQVSYPYTIANGYAPLAPGAGLAVLAAWTLVLLLLAQRRLARSDA
ncbi:MAG: hypothetical protein ACRDMJ_07440 [Solirubrobacteraceae bacterium]